MRTSCPNGFAGAKIALRGEGFLETDVQSSVRLIGPRVEVPGVNEGQPGPLADSRTKPPVTWPRMPLEGHWQRTRMPLRALSERERRVVIATILVTALAVVALIVATAGKSRPEPGPGCIRATIAHVMGGEELNACGARARRTCDQNASLEDPNALSIQQACRKAGYL
jgi:hypothetical protein